MNIQNEIKNYIVENILFGDGTDLQPDASFQENGIMDSMSIMELIAFISKTYDIEIEDSDLVPENFDTLQDISRLVDSKTNSCTPVNL